MARAAIRRRGSSFRICAAVLRCAGATKDNVQTSVLVRLSHGNGDAARAQLVRLVCDRIALCRDTVEARIE